MELSYNATGSDRKRLVAAISEYTGVQAVYLRMPTCAYQIDYLTVTREGNLKFDDMADSNEIDKLMEVLAQQGFVADHFEYDSVQQEPVIDGAEPLEDCPPAYDTPQGEPAGLIVSVPLEQVAVDNLNNLLEAKGSLIKKALGVNELPIEIAEGQVSFPWFTTELTPGEIKAYTHFIAALCEMARYQKRITAKEKEVDNEKYAFRCFLLRLGFIGAEYKEERKILLRNLTGSSAFKGGQRSEVEVCE